MKNQYFNIFTQKNIAVLLLLGFASGLPLALTGGTLQAWVTDSGYDIKTIGFMTLVGQAYVFKFLWAPLMDRYAPPMLGRRRGWLIITQFILAGLLFAMSFLDPKQHLFWLATLAVAVAFFSASQDIVFDAYKTDLLPANERGMGAAVSVLGYRIAMLVSGGLALFLAGFYSSWQLVYQLMAVLMLLSSVITYWASEPTEIVAVPKTLEQAIVIPFNDFFSRNNAWLILLLIVFYKLGDSFAASLSTTFLMKGPQFSLEEIGVINKSLGLFATIVGAIIGGMIMIRMSLFRALLFFGLLQAISNLGYWLLSLAPLEMIHTAPAGWIMTFAELISGNSHLFTQGQLILSSVIFLENICGGMGTSAFVALLMTLCNRSFSASQFAFLSALSAVGRVYVGPVSGWLVSDYGWADFYLFTVIVSFPGLILLWLCKDTLNHTQETGNFATRTFFASAYRNTLRLLAVAAIGLVISLLIMLTNGIASMVFDVSFTSIAVLNQWLLKISAVLCLCCFLSGATLDYLALRKAKHISTTS